MLDLIILWASHKPKHVFQSGKKCLRIWTIVPFYCVFETCPRWPHSAPLRRCSGHLWVIILSSLGSSKHLLLLEPFYSLGFCFLGSPTSLNPPPSGLCFHPLFACGRFSSFLSLIHRCSHSTQLSGCAYALHSFLSTGDIWVSVFTLPNSDPHFRLDILIHWTLSLYQAPS